MSNSPFLIYIVLHSHMIPSIRPARVRTIPTPLISPISTLPCRTINLLDPSLGSPSRRVSPHSCLTPCLHVRLSVVVGLLTPPKFHAVDRKCWTSSDASPDIVGIPLGDLIRVSLLLFAFASASTHDFADSCVKDLRMAVLLCWMLDAGCYRCWVILLVPAFFCFAFGC